MTAREMLLASALEGADQALSISITKAEGDPEVKTVLSGTMIGLMVASSSLVQRVADELAAGPDGVAALIMYRDIIDGAFERAVRSTEYRELFSK